MVASGRKIAGNAQYRTRDAVIQHGSLSYALAPERHLGVFAAPGVDEAAFRERVTSIHEESGIDREAAVAAVEDALASWCDATEGSGRTGNSRRPANWPRRSTRPTSGPASGSAEAERLRFVPGELFDGGPDLVEGWLVPGRVEGWSPTQRYCTTPSVSTRNTDRFERGNTRNAR